MILNHIIVLTNVFGVEAAGTLLFFKEPESEFAQITETRYINFRQFNQCVAFK